ncbi:myeloperoxidase-like [Mya arenaria]|uniref:myeloperoxidase-like n=1 Tax=Mya arenaria TaxID=6604 RepID=UPI0022E0C2D4|nr:myeloperoxidase-like [Mya arenaria]
MGFPRSIALCDCNGVRQPVNSQTAYLDLSVTYGVSEAENRRLRESHGGLMKMNGPRLSPDIDDTECELNMTFDPNTFYCNKAGDPRVDEMPALSGMQTLFVRAHNAIASGLADVNPAWSNERLFQESRKILVAIWQNIVYGEYLPIVLGRETVKKLKIDIKPKGYKDTYKSTTDATVINAVAGAAFRYGHTILNRGTGQMDINFNLLLLDDLANNFFKPNIYHSYNGTGHHNVLRWATSERCPLLDRKVERSVQERLFIDSEGNSFDLVALNIQRGRGHGLPGYNAYRKFCDLSEASNFGTGNSGLVDHDESIARLLEDVYECPDDIDLFTGIITERRGSEGLLGPLGTCLLGEQFKRFRDGDRFFFERNVPAVGFTRPQIDAIKQITMASLICQHTSTTTLQRNVFVMPTISMENERVSCETIPRLDLSLWIDT